MTAITLLDGGMGQELVRRLGDAPTPLWGTQAMADHPGLVAGLHGDYFAAGATVATANTYAIMRDRLEHTPHPMGFEGLFEMALQEAENARENASGNVRIAGAIGPLIASYRPDLFPGIEDAVPVYEELVNLMANRVDLIVYETVSSVEHATAAMAAATGVECPVWIAVTVTEKDGTKLRSGEDITDLAHLEPDAWLANCSPPEVMDDAIAELAKLGQPFGAYANGFTKIADGFLVDRPTVDALSRREDLSPERYADFVMGWVKQGATIVGGCCETFPAHISEIASRLKQEGYKIA